MFDREIVILKLLLSQLRAHLAASDDEGGHSTEAVIVTALLAVAAITALGYIVNKIISAAKGVQTQ
jgi:hypothetical protein